MQKIWPSSLPSFLPLLPPSSSLFLSPSPSSSLFFLFSLPFLFSFLPSNRSLETFPPSLVLSRRSVSSAASMSPWPRQGLNTIKLRLDPLQFSGAETESFCVGGSYRGLRVVHGIGANGGDYGDSRWDFPRGMGCGWWMVGGWDKLGGLCHPLESRYSGTRQYLGQGREVLFQYLGRFDWTPKKEKSDCPLPSNGVFHHINCTSTESSSHCSKVPSTLHVPSTSAPCPDGNLQPSCIASAGTSDLPL